MPTTATLTAFVVFTLVVAGLAGAAAPLATSDDATITEPGSAHPIASQVPATYAEPLRARGIAASPEILLFGVHDGEPYFARGAEYKSFAAVSNATLVAGHPPTTPAEAVIGVDLARTLDVEVGDSFLVGGSVRHAVTRVRIVGTFDGTGATDDQLIVTLDTARHLTRVGPSNVNFIRAERLPVSESRSSPVAVTEIAAPTEVAANAPFEVSVTVRNDGLRRSEVTRTVRFDGTARTFSLRVPANSARTATLQFSANETGQYRLSVGSRAQRITVTDPDALTIRGLPDRAPPDSQPLIRVLTVNGTPVENATVRAGQWSGQTNAAGQVRVPLETTGRVQVRVTTDSESVARTVSVETGATRQLRASLALSPASPTFVERPELTVGLTNPWNRSVTRTITIAGGGEPVDRTVTVPVGERRDLRVEFPRRQPGSYDVSVASDAGLRAETTYTVSGDDRIVAALASSGRTGTTGIGQAAAVALGNLQLALAILLLLGAAMTIGGAGAAFAGAVHSKRREIGVHRAVGATRLQICRLVLADALRLGTIAVVVAILAGVVAFDLLGRAGLLTVYGVRMQIGVSWALLGALSIGSLLVVLIGAAIATTTVLTTEPAGLLRGGDRR